MPHPFATVLTLRETCIKAWSWYTERQFTDSIELRQLPDQLKEELLHSLPNDRLSLLPDDWPASKKEVTDLVWPAKRGDLSAVQRLIADGGTTGQLPAIEQATMRGHSQIVELILTEVEAINDCFSHHLDEQLEIARGLLPFRGDDLLPLIAGQLNLPYPAFPLLSALPANIEQLSRLIGLADDKEVQYRLLFDNRQLFTHQQPSLTVSSLLGELMLPAVADDHLPMVRLLLMLGAIPTHYVCSRLIIGNLTMLQLLMQWVELHNQWLFATVLDRVAVNTQPTDLQMMEWLLQHLGFRTSYSLRWAAASGNLPLLKLLLGYPLREISAVIPFLPSAAYSSLVAVSPPTITDLVEQPEDEPSVVGVVKDSLIDQAGGHPTELSAALPAPRSSSPTLKMINSESIEWRQFPSIGTLSEMERVCLHACLAGQLAVVQQLDSHTNPYALTAAIHGLPPVEQQSAGHYQLIRYLANHTLLASDNTCPFQWNTRQLAVLAASRGHLWLANWLLSYSTGDTFQVDFPSPEQASQPLLFPETITELSMPEDLLRGAICQAAGQLPAVKWLVECTARCFPLAATKRGNMAAQLRIYNAGLVAATMATNIPSCQRLAIMDYLVANGADDPEQALIAAADRHHPDIISWLVKQGAIHWQLAMEWAALHGNVETMAMLRNGDIDYQPVAMRAIDGGSMATIRWLLPRLANIGQLVDYAVSRRKHSIACWLLTNGQRWYFG